MSLRFLPKRVCKIHISNLRDCCWIKCYILYNKLSLFLPPLHYLLHKSYQQLSAMVNNKWLHSGICCNNILLDGVRSQYYGTSVRVCVEWAGEGGGSLHIAWVWQELGIIAWAVGVGKYACNRVISLFLSQYVTVIPFNDTSDIHFHIIHAISRPWL